MMGLDWFSECYRCAGDLRQYQVLVGLGCIQATSVSGCRACIIVMAYMAAAMAHRCAIVTRLQRRSLALKCMRQFESSEEMRNLGLQASAVATGKKTPQRR
jgi:hypothetical protein